MTLKKIAKLANVSVSTVSRALNDSYDIADETKTYILEIAAKSGYFQKKKRTKMDNMSKSSVNIAIICPEIISQFYSGIAQILVKEFKRESSRCIIYNCDFEHDGINAQLKKCINDPEVHGIICLSNATETDKVDIPFVSFNPTLEHSSIHTKISNAAEKITEYFEQQGIKKIAFVGEKNTVGKSDVFFNTLSSRQISCSEFVSDYRFDKAGRQGAEHLLKNGLPQAVICAYDEIALGLISTLEENGIKVPDDVRVVGINDIPAAKYCFGGLSTISYDFKNVCPQIAKDMLEDIRTGKTVKRKYTVKTDLIIRNT